MKSSKPLLLTVLACAIVVALVHEIARPHLAMVTDQLVAARQQLSIDNRLIASEPRITAQIARLRRAYPFATEHAAQTALLATLASLGKKHHSMLASASWATNVQPAPPAANGNASAHIATEYSATIDLDGTWPNILRTLDDLQRNHLVIGYAQPGAAVTNGSLDLKLTATILLPERPNP